MNTEAGTLTQPAAAAQSAPTTEADIRAAIRAVVCEISPGRVTDVTGESRLIEDLDYHSLALLELAFALEDDFRLEPIDREVAEKIKTVNDIEVYVLSKLAAR